MIVYPCAMMKRKMPEILVRSFPQLSNYPIYFLLFLPLLTQFLEF